MDATAPGTGRQEFEDTRTTSISIPVTTPAQEGVLSDEDRKAIAALPVGSALLIASEGPSHGARFLLDQDVTTVGRHPEADIFLDDVTVSRRHAEFLRVDDGFRLEDRGSLNGTYVNNDRVDAVDLRSGMAVQIGKFRMTYHAGTQAVGA